MTVKEEKSKRELPEEECANEELSEVADAVEQKNGKRKGAKVLFKLFYWSLFISSVAFGGGFVVLSLLRETFVKKLKWVTDEEMFDLNALAQASPGAIALNTSMLVGFKVAGFLGAIVTIIGSVIPPMAVITALYYFYDAIKGYALVGYLMQGMQAGVAAVIISLVIDMWQKVLKDNKSVFTVLVLVLSFAISTLTLFLFNYSTVIYVVILSAILGIGCSYLSYFREKKKGDKK